MRSPRKTLTAAAAGCCLLLAGCGGNDAAETPAESVDRSAEIEAAMAEGGELTLWTWSTKFDGAIEAFEAEHPNIDVELVNSGQSAEQYTALQNAVSAGENIPDLAMIEYFALPQLALSEQLESVNDWGLDTLEDQFTASSWEQMSYNGATYGLPNNTGPLILIYNQEVFESAGAEVPATWEEFAEAAELIKEDSGAHITSMDPGDAGGLNSLIWQGGGRPYQVDGESVGVDFSDESTQRVSGYWSDLLADDLVSAQPGWTDEWWRGLGDGSLASWVTGAWALGNISGTLTDNEGDFRVAPAPVWDADAPENAENGGSGFSVVSGGENTALAMGFLEWFSTHEASLEAQVAGGNFPAQTATLEDPEYLDQEIEYFDGQQANQVLAEASGLVAEGWHYMPYQVYANSVFGDSVGPRIDAPGDVHEGLEEWGEELRSYGEQQGFDVG
ncbi:ABC transporter substrate-binding protein [Nocardiopsis ganjiahuensis]|uniref:ABC transporter substrate-binding protein n=1 Tax=Nocardiopsis ganjiahuensis TaxID=239984 RepID=UPI001EF9F327|nr:extracellular solute-binding protein [Nocardiopsis ganjiahuensis]